MHTPGPWTFVAGQGGFDIDSEHPTGISGDPCGETVGKAYRVSDARLIAAAPELLEACRNAVGLAEALEALVADIPALRTFLPGLVSVKGRIATALAKAEGVAA